MDMSIYRRSIGRLDDRGICLIELYILLGIGAGVLAGLLGVGGGLIIVPALAAIFTYLHYPSAVLMHMAIATSLATIVMRSVSGWRDQGSGCGSA